MHSRAVLIGHDGKRSTSSKQQFALDVFVEYSFFSIDLKSYLLIFNIMLTVID